MKEKRIILRFIRKDKELNDLIRADISCPDDPIIIESVKEKLESIFILVKRTR